MLNADIFFTITAIVVPLLEFLGLIAAVQSVYVTDLEKMKPWKASKTKKCNRLQKKGLDNCCMYYFNMERGIK